MKRFTAWLLALSLLLTAGLAWASEADPAPTPAPEFTLFGEALAAAGENPVMGATPDYAVLIVEKDGEYRRVVANLDEKAAKMQGSLWEAADYDAAHLQFVKYLETLPVSSVEVFIAKPKDQAELDALAGKTIRQLEDAGYITSSYGTGGEDRIVFEMSYGLYAYEFVVDADFALFEKKRDEDDLGSLVVVSGRFVHVSNEALNLSIHPDGTTDPEPEFADEMPAWMKQLAEVLQNGGDVNALLESLPPEAAAFAPLIMQYLSNPENTPVIPPAE